MMSRSISPAAVWRTRSKPARRGRGRDARPVGGGAAGTEPRLQGDGQIRLVVTAVDCLAVCKRPCTVAFSGADKWTYLIGDLDPESHVDEIVSAAKSFAASENGIVPWRERPGSFRKGVSAAGTPLNPKE